MEIERSNSGSVHGGLAGRTANYRSLGKVTIDDIFEVLWAGDAVPSQSAPAIQPETVQVGFAFAGRYPNNAYPERLPNPGLTGNLGVSDPEPPKAAGGRSHHGIPCHLQV
ncbi:MAG: hypothetical protein HY646_18135 [Acidobacteria bacterium]|nr:hypothetical protein [Acidobacteriota bacterium]